MPISYAEKLKDPRWQRKRLEVLQRENFTCQECKSNNKPLHVHHHNYYRGQNPWDYNDFDLACYCEDCHAVREYLINEIKPPTEVMSNQDLGFLAIIIRYSQTGPESLKRTALFLRSSYLESKRSPSLGLGEDLLLDVSKIAPWLNEVCE